MIPLVQCTNLPWIIGVWCLVVLGVTKIRADYEDLSCAREGRTLKPLVPCDLLRDSFCDTSGDTYPWKKLRQFVFENQAMVKRMYGYEKHLSVLQDEFDLLQYDESDVVHMPAEKYLQANQNKVHTTTPASSTRRRNSIRSNAFKPRSIATESFVNIQRLDDGKDQQGKNRNAADARSLKVVGSANSQQPSVNSSFKSRQEDKFKNIKESSNFKDRDTKRELGVVRISQGYSSRTKSGAGEDTLPNGSTEQGTQQKMEDFQTGIPTSRPPTSNNSSAEDEMLTTPNFSGSRETTAKPSSENPDTEGPLDPSEDLFDFLGEEEHGSVGPDEDSFLWESREALPIMVSAENVTQPTPKVGGGVDGSTVSSSSDLQDDFTTKSPPPSSTGPKPPSETLEPTTTALPPVSEISNSSSAESTTQQFNLDYAEEVQTEEAMTMPSDISVEFRTSAGIEISDDEVDDFLVEESINTEFSPTHQTDSDSFDRPTTLGTVRPSTTTTHSSDGFKFPEEREDPMLQSGSVQHQVKHNSSNRRVSNGKRPAAYGESRQPSHSSFKVRPSTYAHRADQPKVVVAHQGDAQPIRWTRFSSRGPSSTTTTTSSSTTTTTSTLPPRPTPSSVPAPSVNVQRRGFNACPVETGVTTPYWANNTRGEPRAILNLSPFDQYVHWEKCRFEYSQMDCRSGCRCEQQYRLHRMLAFDPFNDCRGVFSDWFRFPSGCVCKCYTMRGGRGDRAPHSRKLGPTGRHLDEELDDEEGMSSAQDGGYVNDEVLGELVEEDNPSDLTDVFFESVDDFMTYGQEEDDGLQGEYLHEAQDRMDEGYSTEEEENLQELPIEEEEEPLQELLYPPQETEEVSETEPPPQEPKIDDEFLQNLKRKIADHAVLEGEPVHSLYSHASARAMLQEQPKVNPVNISPQRRPRPQHIITRYSRVNPLSLPSIYKSSFDQLHDRLLNARHRMNRYSVPKVYQKSSFSPSFRSQPKYFSSNMNGWNPQASFPKTLSNPRFKKYLDSPLSSSSSLRQANRRESRTSKSIDSKNFNLNHFMESSSQAYGEPTPPPSPGSGVTHGTLNVQTPHYFFNLTSHLIRTQQRDSRLPNFRKREPRNAEENSSAT